MKYTCSGLTKSCWQFKWFDDT